MIILGGKGRRRKVKRKYDRKVLLALKKIWIMQQGNSEQNKERLKEEYARPNPAELKKITKLQNKLMKLKTLKEELRGEQQKEIKDFEYIFDVAIMLSYRFLHEAISSPKRGF